MKINIGAIIKYTFLAWLFILQALTFMYAQKETKVNVYVWDFKSSQAPLKGYAEKFTNDFETELIKINKYRVLQRRNHNLVLAHRNMENSISNIDNLTSNVLDELKIIRAEIVVFGQLYEDIDSGIYEVSVMFQNLNNGEIQKKETMIIEKALIKSNSHRKQYMNGLIKKLHIKEILKEKEYQFGFISKKLDTYIVRVKDVQIAFNDIIEIALEKEEYFKELELNINAYNEIFMDLNDNKETHLMDFGSIWGKTFNKDLEDIYKGILEDIHKKHILKLNNVKKKIWAYRGNALNKKEKEKLKKEIQRDTETSSLGLIAAIDKTEDQINTLFLKLKMELNSAK